MFSNEGSTGAEPMASVYEQVLGADFASLHPLLRTYFGAIPAGFEGIGVGRFEHAGLRIRALRPLFVVLGRRGIAFAERADDVPFTVRNTRGADGRLHAVRSFRFQGVDRMMADAMCVVDGRLVDRIGRRGEFEAELAARVTDGRLVLASRRVALRVFGMRLPIPLMTIEVREEAVAHDDRAQRVQVRVCAPLVGEVYGYGGTFTYSLEPAADQGSDFQRISRIGPS